MIEYLHRKADDQLHAWLTEIEQRSWFSEGNDPAKYHAISYDGVWGHVTVEYAHEVRADGKTYVPLCMLSDYKNVGRKMLKKWTKDQLHKTKLIMAYKVAYQIFEIDQVDGGPVAKTSTANKHTMNNLSQWLDPLGRLTPNGETAPDGGEFCDWLFSKEDWNSGVYHELYKNAIENF
jgi:hypothetical protein